MLSNVYHKEIEELYQTPIVQQTAFWSDVKNKLGAQTIAIDFKSNKKRLFADAVENQGVCADLLVIVQQVSSHACVAYVPYGPEVEPDEETQGRFLEELSESLRSFLPLDCIMIRYDLCWESYWAKDLDYYDEKGNWLGEPELTSQELRFNFNTTTWNFRKAHFNNLPSNTIFVDLKPDIENILQRMKPKTRYNIKLSERKGVTVLKAGMESLPVWYALYKETARRNGIYLNDIKYFEAILQAKAENTNSPAKVQLLIATYENIPLAAMFLTFSGNRASYLFGASSSLHRNFMSTYALQWEAMQLAKSRNCTEYDMFGVSPNPDQAHPLYGLYKFKVGFGGNLFHRMGCWDYPLKADKYIQFRQSELLSPRFHVN